MKAVRVGFAFGLGASVFAHAALYLMLRWAGELPAVGIDFSLPVELELGVTDGAPLQSGALAPADSPQLPNAAAPEPQPVADAPAVEAPKPKPKRKKPKPAPVDAGVADAAPLEQAPANGTHDAGAAGAEGTAKPQLAAYAPPGAQLALRLDMDRVRASPLAADAALLLAAIPDVGFILDGSGIDPLSDLSRLFLASPNLKRESFVLAGRYVGGEDVPTRAVAALAAAQGKKAKWSRRGTVRVAPWQNTDATPRVLALLAPSLFAITRPDDLPRILAVARALASRDRNPKQPPSDDDAATALLAMAKDEVLVFSVENAKAFARGQEERVPDRFTLSIRTSTDSAVEIFCTATYDSDEAASSATDFWREIQAKFARHPLVALVGLSGPVRDTTLTPKGTQLVTHTTLSVEQVRRILAFARDTLATQAARRTAGTSAKPAAGPAPAVRDTPPQ